MPDSSENLGTTALPVKETAGYWSRRRLLVWLLAAATVAAFYALLPSVHKATIKAEDVQRGAIAPRLDGTHPCVFASVSSAHVVTGVVVTGVGQCATPALDRREVDRFETDLRYGAFVLRQSDLFVKDVFDVPLTRTYTSQDWNCIVHAFGCNSNHSYDIAPTGSRWPYTFIRLMLEDSDFLYFKRISEGTGYADAVFMHTETSTPFYKATIAWNGNGWTLRLTDGTEMHFPESYNAKNLAQGAAFELIDAAGNKLKLNRDSQRNLEEIRTPHDRWLRFEYDSKARIIHARDDNGNSVQYGYNKDGMLISAIESSGAARVYQYQGFLMTAVMDERGRTLVRNWYDDSKILIAQVFANGDVYHYRYQWGPNNHYAEKVVVTLPDHSEKEIYPADTVPDFIRLSK